MWLKRISVIVLSFFVMMIPIATIADNSFTDTSTGTIISLPNDWKKLSTDDSLFSYHFGTTDGLTENLYYLSEGVVRIVPSKYQDDLIERNPSIRVEQVMTTSFPLEMYSDLFGQPIEYFSLVSINGVDYVRVDYYKLQNTNKNDSPTNAWMWMDKDTILYVSIIAATMYVFKFESNYIQSSTSNIPHSTVAFENRSIPEYEKILSNIRYSYIESQKAQKAKTTKIVITAAAVVLGITTILVIEKLKEKKNKFSAVSHNEIGNAIALDEQQEKKSNEPSNQPSNAVTTTSPIAENVSTDTICYCRKCGKPLLPDSLFCDSCGTKVL